MTGEKHLTHQNFSAGVLIIWGVFTISPYDTSFVKNPQLYAAMTFLVESQFFWGVFFASLGAAGVFLNYKRRSAAALMMGIAFTFFASLFFFGDYASRAWAYYAFFAVWNLTQWKNFKFEGKRS